MKLSQEFLDKIFIFLRQIHNSHWKAPSVETVNSELKRAGKFVFRIGANPFVAELIITDSEVKYEMNSELSLRMRDKAEQMKKQFDDRVKQM